MAEKKKGVIKNSYLLLIISITTLLSIIFFIFKYIIIGVILFTSGFIIVAIIINITKKTENKTIDNQIRNIEQPLNENQTTIENDYPTTMNTRIIIKPYQIRINEKDEKSNRICLICKLEIRNKQQIYQCPNCESLFHREHLEEWLATSKKCPVCNLILISY
ncbi:MAG: E3 ubiquitin protein ligase [Asgard group archaeon]|nr:E3 ubiquitin protein ligase [Asgard group archaeon]